MGGGGGVVKPNTACTFLFSVSFSHHKMSQSIKKLIVSDIKFNNLSSCTSQRCLFSGFISINPPSPNPDSMRALPFWVYDETFRKLQATKYFCVLYTLLLSFAHTSERKRQRKR